jgi:Phosphotransferase enzyme family
VWRDPRDLIAPMRARLATFTVPSFVRTEIDQVLAETPPPRQRPLVTSHNDTNPSNLVFDGERLLLLDWDMAGPNDPFYDLAAVAMFLRMDDPTASALIAAYDAATPAALPDGFVYARRLVAALCATIFLHLAPCRSPGWRHPRRPSTDPGRGPGPHRRWRTRPEHRRRLMGVRARAGPDDHGSRRAEAGGWRVGVPRVHRYLSRPSAYLRNGPGA